MKNPMFFIITFLFQITIVINAQENVFLNTTGDHLWNTAANWSLGHIPTGSERAFVSQESVIIANGVQATCDTIIISDSLRIQNGGSILGKYINIAANDVLINNGTITLSDISYANIGQFGKTLNYGTIDINSTGVAIDFREGEFHNYGTVNISNAEDEAILFLNLSIPKDRKLINHIGANLTLTNCHGSNIHIRDSLRNDGIIHILNPTPLGNFPAEGLTIESAAVFLNSGEFLVSNSQNFGIKNIGGQIINETGGEIEIINFGETAIKNDFLLENHGEISIQAGALSNDGIGIDMNNVITNFSGAYIDIDGNNYLQFGFKHGTSVFHNMSGATLTISQIDNLYGAGLETVGGIFTNDGLVSINQVGATGTYAWNTFAPTIIQNNGISILMTD